MKAKDYPMNKTTLFKLFSGRDYLTYDMLTDEQKEYEITHTATKKIGTEKGRYIVISSPEEMAMFNMKPKNVKFGK